LLGSDREPVVSSSVGDVAAIDGGRPDPRDADITNVVLTTLVM
jgi:hypothetical protein